MTAKTHNFHKFRRILFLIGLGVFGLVCVSTYANLHYYLKAKRDIGNLNQKIKMLTTANGTNPFNDAVYHELGKAYFQLGMNSIGRPEQRDEFLFLALENLIISVRLNPGYYQTHFHLAQAMMYLNYFSSREFDYIEEYKKAALLNNFDKEAYFEVGRILLSKWPELSPEDRNFCLAILKKITAEAGMSELRSIIQVWAAVVKDYRVMDELLPKSARLFRMYAELLGEISLDIDVRRLKMAEAEQMDFEEALAAHDRAQTSLRFYRFGQAEDLFSSALDNLENIRFYQSLAGLEGIDAEQLSDLKRSSRLGLLKAKVALKKSYAELKDLFCSTVMEAGEQGRLKELESMLIKNNYLDRSGFPDLSDLDRAVCRLSLDFARRRYQDIIRFGEHLKTNLLLSGGDSGPEYARIFELLGDSYSKLDYIYDAGNFYRRAHRIDADNPVILSKLLAHYERLNRGEEAAEVIEKLEALRSPEQIDIRNAEIVKGQLFQLPLRLEYESVELTLIFEGMEESDPTLLSVFFNGPVIMENYVGNNSLTLTLNPTQAENILEIRPINREVKLTGISWRPEASSVDVGL